MKNIFLTAMTVFATVATVSAQADMRPWDRPIERAQMKISSAEGTLSKVQYAQITRTNKRLLVTFNNDQQLAFDILETADAGCGSKKVSAEGVVPARPGHRPVRFFLQLVDHRTRICEDYRPYMWDVRINQIMKSAKFQAGVPVGTLILQGTPSPVYSTQVE